MKKLFIALFILVALTGVISVSLASDGRSNNQDNKASQISELQSRIDRNEMQRFDSFHLETQTGVLRSRMFYSLLSSAQENLQTGNTKAARHYLELAEQLKQLPKKQSMPGVVQNRAYGQTPSFKNE